MAAQDLCTLSDVKTALETTDSSRDTLIGTLITQASEAIMAHTGREFAPATASATRRFRVDGFTVQLEPYDLRTVSAATLNPEGSSPRTLTVTTEYQLLPIGAPSGTYTQIALSPLLAEIASSQTAFSFGWALLDITGAWGFASVPEDAKRAAVITVCSWLRKDVTGLLSQIDIAEGIAPAFPTTLEIPNNAKTLLEDGYGKLRSYVC